MILRNLKEKAESFLNSHAENAINRHQIIIYLLHTALVVIVAIMQFTKLGGSQDMLPKSMSVVHLIACLTSLSLFLSRKLSVSAAFTLVALVAQATIICRFIYFSQVRPENFLHFIMLNQMISLLAVVFLVMCFVKYTPYVVTAISLTAYVSVASYLKEPALWNIFGFFLGAQFFLCMLGELLRQNVQHVQAENTDLHQRETTLMRVVRMNEREIEGYLRIANNDSPMPEDTDRLFAMLSPKSQRNLVNAMRLHLKNHLMDDIDIAQLFPVLTKSEADVCNLILQGKKRGEICHLLEKKENNIDVVRAHIRKKLDIPSDIDLRKFLMDEVIEKRFLESDSQRL